MFTRSGSVRPFLGSLRTMSLTVPVIVPPGSPFALSSADGPALPLRSASVSITGAGTAAAGGACAGAAAGSAAGAGACARATPGSATLQTNAKTSSTFLMALCPLIDIQLSLPDCVLRVGLVDHAKAPDQA